MPPCRRHKNIKCLVHYIILSLPFPNEGGGTNVAAVASLSFDASPHLSTTVKTMLQQAHKGERPVDKTNPTRQDDTRSAAQSSPREQEAYSMSGHILTI